ncbi:MAG: sigma-70 family RNA polymerase sigma factor [Eubacteriales bacterium]
MESGLRELLEGVQKGDTDAFERLAEKYHSLTESAVRRFASSFGISGESGRGDNVYDADDLRQCAAMALYRAAVTYRPDEEGREVSFGLYAKICVNNAIISELRKYRRDRKKRALRSAENADAMEDTAEGRKRRDAGRPSGEDPLYRLLAEESMRETLERVRSALSGYEKEIFECYIVGKSVTEIAERLGKDKKSVSNALYRVKVKIRGLLKI